jgi:tetratricopeptide (TPR) repeat protein
VARTQAVAPKLLAAFSAGLLYWAVGDYAAAQEVHQALMPYLEEAGVSGYLEQNLANLGVDAALVGDWEAAHRYARLALAQRTYQSLPLMIKPHWPETEALLRGGDRELAHEDTRRWGELVAAVPRLRVGYLRSLALLAEWDEDTRQAIAHLQEALALSEEIGLSGEQWPILVKLGALYRNSDDEEKARSTFAQVAEIVQALAAKIGDEKLENSFLRSNEAGLTAPLENLAEFTE